MIKILLLLSTVSFAEIQESNVRELMSKAGETFNALQKAVIVNKDLSEKTFELNRKLTELFELALSSTPNLDDITKDPKKRDELLAAYKEIMADTVNVSLATEQSILEKNLEKTKTNLTKLKEKRTQGHDIFKPQGEYSNEYYRH
ncbi:MAG: hypothetical protein A4S09_08940 [Proteobacteria bacterium SG_bin7]|nr:MAG: hypothetical protein A4S09_08940 [Proteobacteria bacterium SG_bin7]